jgi:hypothetical protein
VDLFINAIVCASSLVLFLYWFRYGCLLILAAETPHDYGADVAVANHLSFPEVRSMLRSDEGTDLAYLKKCLERDFAIIANLLQHTPARKFDAGFEDAMLTIHFRAMSACFHLTKNSLRGFALDALEEMLLVVAHLANEMGGRRLRQHA